MSMELESKGAFLASVDSAKPSEQQQAEPESISVHVFDSVAIATGIFREKGVAKGKAYVRRSRFVDTWISHKGRGYALLPQRLRCSTERAGRL